MKNGIMGRLIVNSVKDKTVKGEVYMIILNKYYETIYFPFEVMLESNKATSSFYYGMLYGQ